MNKKIFGVVKNGKFTAENKNEFVMAFSHFEGKDVEIVVKKRGKNKNRQYRYLYSVVYQCIADHINDCVDQISVDITNEMKVLKKINQDDVDYLMKLKFYFDFDDRFGVRIPKKKSSNFFQSKDFSVYIENIKRWAWNKYQLRIPEPNEVDYEM